MKRGTAGIRRRVRRTPAEQTREFRVLRIPDSVRETLER